MNDRSKYVWAKFKQWYGTSFTERYGENPPPDWMQALNDPDKETITNALSAIRTAHPKFPPTLMEVMTAIQKVTRPTVTYDVRKILSEFVLREYHAKRLGITFRQLGRSWNWLADLQPGLDYQNQMRENQICNYVGVFIPPDPCDANSRGCRVMLGEIPEYDKGLLLAKSKSRYSAGEIAEGI